MQNGALLLDSLRMLRSRKLFWISLGISAIVMAAYASIGFGENGLSLFFGLWEMEDPFFVAGSAWARTLYLGIYSNFVVTIWLAWAASILALVSTSSVFPDFMTAGSIEMVLSKPISRVRIFLVKFVGSLLFVLVQLVIFCTGIFICVGVRIDEWIWPIFAAVPLVTVFFSYLYAFNVLMGLLTRSSLAALLFTAVFWFILFAVQSGETVLSQVSAEQAIRYQRIETRMEAQRERLAGLERSERPSDRRQAERTRTELEANESRLAEAGDRMEVILAWHRPLEIAMAILPKNQETIDLLDRWLSPDANYTMTEIMLGDFRETDAEEASADPLELDEEDPAARRRERREIDREATRQNRAEARETSPWFIIGTSLLFEAVLLAVGAWLFSRRDF